MGQIIDTIYSNWTAPPEWLNQLAASTPAECRINGGGEVFPRIAGLSDPIEAAARGVMSGQIWVDYCGYPMYYVDTPMWGLPAWRAEEKGFNTFLRTGGVLFNCDFWANREAFQFPRSLRVLEERVPNFVTPNLNTPHTSRIFSCFALKMGDGYYFYAYAHPSGEGVPPNVFSQFISRVLAPPPPVPAPFPIPIPPEILGIPTWAWALGAGLAGLAVVGLVRRSRRGEGEK